jgi:hypothetical protein
MGKSGARCTVCASKHRHAIEIGLVHGISMRVLADRFGLHKDAIRRHGDAHLSATARAVLLVHVKPQPIDLDALRTAESEGLLASMVGQRARLLQTAELALECGDIRGNVAAENAYLANLTTVAKLLGQLVQVHDVRHTSILISQDYLKLRDALRVALAPFPAAARAVAAALFRLESDAARDISEAARKTPAMIEHQPAETVPTTIAPPPY